MITESQPYQPLGFISCRRTCHWALSRLGSSAQSAHGAFLMAHPQWPTRRPTASAARSQWHELATPAHRLMPSDSHPAAHARHLVLSGLPAPLRVPQLFLRLLVALPPSTLSSSPASANAPSTTTPGYYRPRLSPHRAPGRASPPPQRAMTPCLDMAKVGRAPAGPHRTKRPLQNVGKKAKTE